MKILFVSFHFPQPILSTYSSDSTAFPRTAVQRWTNFWWLQICNSGVNNNPFIDHWITKGKVTPLLLNGPKHAISRVDDSFAREFDSVNMQSSPTWQQPIWGPKYSFIRWPLFYIYIHKLHKCPNHTQSPMHYLFLHYHNIWLFFPSLYSWHFSRWAIDIYLYLLNFENIFIIVEIKCCTWASRSSVDSVH